MYHPQLKIYSQCHSFYTYPFQWNCIQNKISPSTGILLNGVLIPNLLNNPFASWFLINLDFLLPHIAHFDNIIALPILVLKISGSMFSVYFFYTLNNMSAFYNYLHVLLINLLHLSP